jgi:hypothetical protein
MPITWRVGGDGHRIEIVFTDPYSIPESERVMKEIFARPELPRPLRFLVDVRNSQPPDMDFIVNATTFWQVHITHMWKAKVAVVAATDAQIGMAEMSERSAEWSESPFTVHVFREVHAAEQWLTEPTP